MVIHHLAVRKASSCHLPGKSCWVHGLTTCFGPSHFVSSRYVGH